MHPKEFLHELYLQRADYKHPSQARTAARLLKTVSADIYSDSLRFLFELIQNADDAALGVENEVHFEVLSTYLVVCHRGKPFTAADIDSITDADASTKTADPTKTGYKGIGFKSVFARSKRVVIWSGGYQFKFDQQASPDGYPWQVIPIWVEADELPVDLRHFVTQDTYAVYTCLELPRPADLTADLARLLTPQLLLFLRRVTRITVAAPGQPAYSVERRCTGRTAGYQHIELLDREQRATTWLLRTFDQLPVPEALREQLADDEKTPEKLRQATVTEVAFAARVEAGRLVALPTGESRLYTYLPTEETGFGFPFLANGTFLTTSSRQSLHQDSAWNQWLFGLLADKLLAWLELLAGTDHALQLLTLLPRRTGGPPRLRQSFDQALRAGIGRHRLVVSADLTPATIGEGLLDDTGLAGLPFLDPAALLAFWATQDAGPAAKPTPSRFVHPAFAHANRLVDYGLSVFRLEHVEGFFRSALFAASHAVADNVALLTYFKQRAEADASGEWRAMLAELPFIYDEAAVLRPPTAGVCFPAEVGEATTELGDIPVIHPLVYAALRTDADLVKWLEKMGVPRPSELAYVTNVLVPALSAGETVVTTENYRTVTNYLLRLHQQGQLSSDLVEALRELPLLTADGRFVAAQLCYLASAYHPLLPLEQAIAELPFVADDYLDNGDGWLEWQQFFRRLKVKDRIELERITANDTVAALAPITHPDWLAAAEQTIRSIGGFGFNSRNRVIGLLIPSFLNLTASNLRYSKLFWQAMLKQEATPATLVAPVAYIYGTGWGENRFRTQVASYFSWFVAEQPCLPTTTGELRPAREVLLNNKDIEEVARHYLPVLDCPIRPNQPWREVLKLRVQLLTSDYLLILSAIATEGAQSAPGQRVFRILGTVYEALGRAAHSGTAEDEALIRQWGTTGRLPSSSLTFERPADLLWITLAGFTDLAGQVKSLYLPALADKELPGFADLLGLLGVRIVDSYIPNVLGARPEPGLKQQLLAILPALAALHERKHHVDLAEGYQEARQQVLATTFYQADSVRLRFTDRGQLVESGPLNVLSEPPAFFFTAPWASPLALYWLVPELENLLRLPGLRQELRLLLELPPGEAQGWLAGQGIVEADVLARCRVLDSSLSVAPAAAPPVPAYVSVAPGPAPLPVPAPPGPVTVAWSFQPAVTPAEAARFTHAMNPGTGGRAGGVPAPPPVAASLPDERLASEADRLAIGRWCEEFVRDQLAAEPARFSVVEWLNEHGERGLPYDFRVVDYGIEKYIEVKGTPSASKSESYFSAAEWRWLFTQQERYAIYRVYEAGWPTARAQVLEHPAERLRQGELLPHPIVLLL